MPQIKLPDMSILGDKFGTLAKYRKNAHRGTDWAFKEGDIIQAMTDGKVEKIFWSDVLGWIVVQSDESGKWFIGYCHLLEKPKSIKAGSILKTGQPIGRCGQTGTAATGPHLHATLSDTIDGVVSGKVYDILKMAKKWSKNA